MDANNKNTINKKDAVKELLGYAEIPVIDNPKDGNYPTAELQKTAAEGNLGAIRLVGAAFAKVRQYGLAVTYYELGAALDDEACKANGVICGAQLAAQVRADLDRFPMEQVIAAFLELMGWAEQIVDPNPQVRGSARFIKLEWATCLYLHCMMSPEDPRVGEMLELADLLYESCHKDLEPEYAYYYGCVLEMRYMQPNHIMDSRFARRYFNLLASAAEKADEFGVGAAACADLGGAFLYGIGTSKNEDKAYQWFKKANDMGMNLTHILTSFKRNSRGKYELR